MTEHIIRVYDNDGSTADRYTVVLSRRGYTVAFGHYPCLSFSGSPDHPQGVSMWGECTIGRHLGRQIRFIDLPDELQEHVIRRIGRPRNQIKLGVKARYR